MYSAVQRANALYWSILESVIILETVIFQPQYSVKALK